MHSAFFSYKTGCWLQINFWEGFAKIYTRKINFNANAISKFHKYSIVLFSFTILQNKHRACLDLHQFLKNWNTQAWIPKQESAKFSTILFPYTATNSRRNNKKINARPTSLPLTSLTFFFTEAPEILRSFAPLEIRLVFAWKRTPFLMTAAWWRRKGWKRRFYATREWRFECDSQ